MIETVRIKNVGIKSGETNGRTWRKCGIQTDKHGDKWLSCFVNQRNENSLEAIKRGDTIDIVVEEKGQYLNFRIPDRIDRIEERVKELEQRIGVTGEEDLEDMAESLGDDSMPF